MLGLGDIVIPGTFVALALRYDYAQYAKTITDECEVDGNEVSGERSTTGSGELATDGHGSLSPATSPTAASSSIKLDENQQLDFRRTAPKPYFHAALVAYVSGLMTTMLVMHVFHAAQPALLYLR